MKRGPHPCQRCGHYKGHHGDMGYYDANNPSAPRGACSKCDCPEFVARDRRSAVEPLEGDGA